MHRLRRLGVTAILAFGVAWLPGGTAARASESVLIKLRREGPHAVRGCAEALTRAGRDLASATADRSDSLDALLRRIGVRRIRAVFRRPEAGDFARAEQALRRRVARARALAPRRALRARRAAPGAARVDAAELAHVYRLELPPGANASAAAADLAADPHVAYAQPDYPVAVDRVLDDPFLTSEGALGPFADLWGIHRIGAPAAWDTTLGEGVLVAVVDTGIDTGHPEIVENLWVNPGEDLDGDGFADPEERNGIDDDGNGFVDDLHGFDFYAEGDGDVGDPEDLLDPDPYDRNGHGTHVAGTIAARGDNGIGIAGVAPRAQVMAVKIFPERGPGDTERAWRGVLYAAENGADVINASWSCAPRCPENPIGEEVARLVYDLGVVFVTSAGNRSDDVSLTSPEKLRETLTVGSLTHTDALAHRSSFGLLLDLVAPGDHILSLRIADPTLWPPSIFVGDAYMWLSGTSMAAPHVAGSVALLLSAHPGLSVEEVRAQLRRTAEDLGEAGPDRRFGHGLVRPDRALLADDPPDARVRVVSPGPGEALPNGPIEVRTRASGDALAALRLDVGRGHGPEAWETLAALGTGESATPWNASTGADARFTLRLAATTQDGEEIQEFAPVHLDRNTPVLVSPAESPAHDPDVSGSALVWSAKRGDAGGVSDLQLGRFGVPGAHGWIAEPGGDRSAALLSRGALAWLERPLDAAPNDRDGLFACLLHGRRCTPFGVSTEPDVLRTPPSLSGRRLVYGVAGEGGFEVMVCELTSRGCTPRPAAPRNAAFPWPLIDGRRLVWVGRGDGGGYVLLTCRISEAGRCTPLATSVTNDRTYLRPMALAEDLLVYQDYFLSLPPEDVFLDFRLRACRLDFETGACPAVDLAFGELPGPADASHGRIVWATPRTEDDSDVMTCRFDTVEPRCPVQRVTHHPSRQTAPRIDHDRVVWDDDREGGARIATFALPTLAALRDREAAVGRRLSFWLHEVSRGGPIAFEGETAEGEALESLGIRIRPRGDGRARVEWRPRAEHVGAHRLRFRAVRPSGLYDERSLVIEVRERPWRGRGPG